MTTPVRSPGSPDAGATERFRIDGRRVLVTGASRGIGRAIALGLAAAGADVALASRRIEGLREVAREVEALGRRGVPVPCHMGRMPEVRAMVAEAASALGGLDVLVNNAAANPLMTPLVDLGEESWDKILDVNLKGPFVACQEAVRRFRAQGGGGNIVNVSSVGGLDPGPLVGAYCVSKAGLITLTQALARELGSEGIRVNAIAPGLIDTKMSAALMNDPTIHEAVVGRAALHRHGEPDEIVGAALFLCSQASSFMTGQTLVVDGGGFLLG